MPLKYTQDLRDREQLQQREEITSVEVFKLRSSAYPPRSDITLRGVGERVDINVGEEFGVLPSSLVYTIIIATMVIAHTILIGISSRPVDKNSPMFRLMDKKWPETGKPIIKTRVFGTICSSCRRRGIKNCGHGSEDPWSNSQQNRKIELLMADKKSTWQREMRNEDVEDDSEPAFIYESVMALSETKRDYGGSEKHSHIFTAIDPAAGGNQSKYAIVSAVVATIYDSKSRTKRTKLVVLCLLFSLVNYIIFHDNILSSFFFSSFL